MKVRVVRRTECYKKLTQHISKARLLKLELCMLEIITFFYFKTPNIDTYLSVRCSFDFQKQHHHKSQAANDWTQVQLFITQKDHIATNW